MTPQIQPGVIVEGPMFPEPVRVAVVQEINSKTRLAGPGARTNIYHDRLLEPHDLALLKVSPACPTYVGNAVVFRLGIEAERLGLAHEYDPYFSLSLARIDPLPHQLEAVYNAMLPLPRIRFLLGDDAGAGKTIMAGLLLKELKARGLVERTLIVAPANLCFQWQREMGDKFRESFEILRGASLRASYGTNPWQEKSQVITSLDWAKRDDVEPSLSRTSWDLIIVDEAHRMSARDADHKTERYQLGERLSKQAGHFLLLTATPHKGDLENFRFFLQLLDEDVYGDITSMEEAIQRGAAPFYLRRTKDSMEHFPDPMTGKIEKVFRRRTVKTAPFNLDGEEYDFYEALTRYVEDQSLRADQDPSARGRARGFTMAMLQRRFASTLYAVRQTLERMHRKLGERLKAAPPPTTFSERRLEDLDELTEDEAQELIEEAEDAALPSERAAIIQERAALERLIAQAKALEARDVSSKLAELKGILTREDIFKNPATKLLVFTEHKDSLDYLVGKLKGWGLSVVQIHGQMPIGDPTDLRPGTRLHAEQEFWKSAQVLVATEAAGEGINLHCAWLLVNYDIPWNPMRLEQRMGRIHRYGQTKDCLIFNFVATNTREGKVLDKLLSRLDAIQKALGSNQVFDVVGEILPPNQIEKLMRAHYAGRMTVETILERIAQDVDKERFDRIFNSTLERLTQTKLVNLPAMVGKKAEARERRLVPEVVEQFFKQSAPLVGLNLPAPGDGVVQVGKLPRPLLMIGERLEGRHGPLSREYGKIAFNRDVVKARDIAVEWVTPGHPLFEAVRAALGERAQEDLRAGAVFYDLHRTAPGWLEVFEVSVKDGRGRTAHRRLFVVETGPEGKRLIRQPTLFLDLIPCVGAASWPPGLHAQMPVDGKAAENFLMEQGLASFLEEVKVERGRHVDMVERHVVVSLNALMDRQQKMLINQEEQKQADPNAPGLAGQIKQTNDRLDNLHLRLAQRHAELARERHLTLADITHIGSAVVLPHPDRVEHLPELSDEDIERIAMQDAMRYEAAQGRIPEDVSADNRGFDILSRHPTTGEVRFIEVKGRSEDGTVLLSQHEYDMAKRLTQDYWLYVVYHCAATPALHPLRDPARLGWRPIHKVEQYALGKEEVLREAGAA